MEERSATQMSKTVYRDEGNRLNSWDTKPPIFMSPNNLNIQADIEYIFRSNSLHESFPELGVILREQCHQKIEKNHH